ncbi:MAG: hypothetical protein M3297_16585 [Thermoproteota archaeon]|nr:hypothetical protein [Thermoproteota archaeon]
MLNEETTNAQLQGTTGDKGALYKVFSSGAVAQILDFFLDHKDFDYSPGEISSKTGLALKTIFREIPQLTKYQLVSNSRKIGKVNMYKLNSNFAPVLLLEKLTIELSKLDFDSDQETEPTYNSDRKNASRVVRNELDKDMIQ